MLVRARIEVPSHRARGFGSPRASAVPSRLARPGRSAPMRRPACKAEPAIVRSRLRLAGRSIRPAIARSAPTGWPRRRVSSMWQ
jgi:hypothetical protein